jgi:hypothetical protein
MIEDAERFGGFGAPAKVHGPQAQRGHFDTGAAQDAVIHEISPTGFSYRSPGYLSGALLLKYSSD